MSVRKFTCARSCALADLDVCRFLPILPTRALVNSHTATVKVEFTDLSALKIAIESMGGTFLGQGEHKLYAGKENGIGFRLPGWQYPLVVNGAGELRYDDYKGKWGKVSSIAKLSTEYSISLAQSNCELLGWQTERSIDGLTVHHPAGGTLVISGDNVDASGFAGAGCHAAIMSLGLPIASMLPKPEFSAVKCEAQTQS